MSAPSNAAATPERLFATLRTAWAGRWTYHSHAWPEGPTGPVVQDEGQATVEAAARGNSLLLRTEGTQFGASVSGTGLFTFDGRRGKVVSAWSDSSSAALFVAEGHFTSNGRLLRLFGRADGPGDVDFDRWWCVELELGEEGEVQQRFLDLSLATARNLLIETTYRRVP